MARSEGIETRHRSNCPASRKPPGKCACQPSYRAVVRNREGKVTRTFHRVQDARAWRAQALADIIRTPRLASKAPTVKAAGDALIDAMERGSARTRSGDPYKPSVTRTYRSMLDLYVIPRLGGSRLDLVKLRDVQAIVDDLLAAGKKPSSVRNAIMPLRVVYRRALRDGQVIASPCSHLEIPARRGRRDRIASPEEAAELLSVLSVRDRALWACAFYAGLRRGEIRALRWDAVDLGNGLLRVEAGWDAKKGRVAPKNRSSERSVIITAALRDALTEHAAANPGDGLVFPGVRSAAFDPKAVTTRADKAWTEARLNRIGLHEARHTCASFFIAAGVNAKTLSEMMGHSSIAFTFDTYGHLMPGSRDESRELVDAYLERALR